MTAVWEELAAGGLLLGVLLSAAGWAQPVLHLLGGRGQGERARPWPADRLERVYLSLVLGTGVLSLLLLFLGLFRAVYPAAAWASLAPGWLLLAIYGRRARQAAGPAEEPGPRPEVPGSPTLRRAVTLVLALSIGGAAVYTLLVHALMPAHEWDEVAYHMALAKLYVQAHAIVPVPYIVHSNWPMNTEMIFVLGLLFRSELVAHLFTWWLSLWTAGGLYLVARRFLDRRIGLLAAALYLTTPLVLRLSGTGLIDVSLAYYGTAAILAYAYYQRERALPWAGLMGLFAGMAAGSKLMGGAYPLFLGLLMVLVVWRSPRLPARVWLGHLALFGGLGFLVVGPWYARSYAFTGNPIWPFLYDLFGGRYWDALGDEYHMASLLEVWTVELPMSLRGLISSVYYVIWEPGLLGGYPKGLGHALPALAALTVAWAAVRRRVPPLGLHLLLAFVLYYIAWFALSSPQVRFLLAALPMLVLVAAISFYLVYDWLRHPLLQGALVLGLVLLLARDYPWLSQGDRDLVAARLPYITGQRPRALFLDERVKPMPAFRAINQQLPEDAVVLLLPYESRGYFLDRSYVWGHPISQRIIRFEEYEEPQGLARDLRAMGITHILENPEWLYTGLRHWEHDRALMLALEAQCGDQVAAWGDVVLYELVECHN